MGVYLYSRLPSTYQEVEYIQTTWTQFIDTWLYADSNIQVETKIEKTVSSQNIPVFWSVQWDWAKADPYYCFIPYSDKWYWGINNSEWNWGTYTDAIGTKYTIVFNNSSGGVVVNNTDIGSCSGAKLYSSSYTLGISCRRASSPDPRLFWQFKYFYFKMYNKTTWAYERDFVPCYRISDGIIWMYDLVNDVFYTNDGTWTFTKWSDVNNSYEHELKNAYIGG